jgi:hypothetical protein
MEPTATAFSGIHKEYTQSHSEKKKNAINTQQSKDLNGAVQLEAGNI